MRNLRRVLYFEMALCELVRYWLLPVATNVPLSLLLRVLLYGAGDAQTCLKGESDRHEHVHVPYSHESNIRLKLQEAKGVTIH